MTCFIVKYTFNASLKQALTSRKSYGESPTYTWTPSRLVLLTGTKQNIYDILKITLRN